MITKTSRRLAGIALACALWTGASLAPAAAQTLLKFNHGEQVNSGRHAAALEFSKKFEQYTNGRYKIQVFCCAQLGNDPKTIEQLAIGGIDFAISAPGSYASYVPTLNLTMLPFMVDNWEQGWKWYDESKWLKEQYAKAPAKGFRFLAPWESGFRQITTREPINTPADTRGKKLRTFPNEMMLWSLEAMGFGIQIMPLPEVYMAIQQGAVAGQENPIDTIYSQKYYEVAPHLTLTNHTYSPLLVTVSEKTWQKLAEPDQKALMRAAGETTLFSRKLVRENEEKLIAEMAAKGAKVNRKPDVEAFRKAVAPVTVKAREKYGADLDAVLGEIAAIRKSTP